MDKVVLAFGVVATVAVFLIPYWFIVEWLVPLEVLLPFPQ